MDEPQPIKPTLKTSLAGIELVVGFLLSPLSWWNDLFINIPLAYLLALPFAFLNRNLFAGSFVIAYLLTNVLGFILMHRATRRLKGQSPSTPPESLTKDAVISLAYGAIIIVLAIFGIVKPPSSPW